MVMFEGGKRSSESWKWKCCLLALKVLGAEMQGKNRDVRMSGYECHRILATRCLSDEVFRDHIWVFS